MSITISSRPTTTYDRTNDKINWEGLSGNKNAINILKNNTDKIFWSAFSANENIFEYDYTQMKENYKELKKEIIQKALHPKNINRWLDRGMDIECL